MCEAITYNFKVFNQVDKEHQAMEIIDIMFEQEFDLTIQARLRILKWATDKTKEKMMDIHNE